MEDNFLSKLAEFKTKVQKLISLHRESEELNARLSTRNKELEARLKLQEEQLIQASNQLKALQMIKMLSGSDEEKHDLKLKVNQLIREVDKCLDVLKS
jgi:hypothetical protein